MDYSEVINAFSKLVETHFIQRCPPVDSLGATATRTSSTGTSDAPATTTPQSDQPESHPDCYRLPQIHLSGECLPFEHICCRTYQPAVICNEMLIAGFLQMLKAIVYIWCYWQMKNSWQIVSKHISLQGKSGNGPIKMITF